MNRSILVTALITAGLSFPASAAAERATFRISSTVHTVCRVGFGSEAETSANRIHFGAVEQLCNNRAGFRVTMTHPTNMQGAAFFIGGHRVPLSPGNETVIIDESHPIFSIQTATLEMGDAQETPITLSFRIEPKGPVY